MKNIFWCFLFSLIFINELKSKDSITLHIFLLDDCIICQDYTPKLNQLYSDYGKVFQFIGYFPNFSSKQPKIDLFKEKYDIHFPLVTDYYKGIASQFGATTLPEVILYNHTTNDVLYQGRIDNKFFKRGKRRNVVTTNELEDALLAITENRPVPLQKTKAVGCVINYSDPISKFGLQK